MFCHFWLESLSRVLPLRPSGQDIFLCSHHTSNHVLMSQPCCGVLPAWPNSRCEEQTDSSSCLSVCLPPSLPGSMDPYIRDDGKLAHQLPPAQPFLPRNSPTPRTSHQPACRLLLESLRAGRPARGVPAGWKVIHSFCGAGEVPFHDPTTSCLLYNDLCTAGCILLSFLHSALVHNKIIWKLKPESISLRGVARLAPGGARACGSSSWGCWDRSSSNAAWGQRGEGHGQPQRLRSSQNSGPPADKLFLLW